MDISDIRYARTGDLNIAYPRFGSGPDVVIIPGLVSNVELAWEHEGEHVLKGIDGVWRLYELTA